MRHRFLPGLLVIAAVTTSTARADLSITFEPKDADMNPVGTSVPEGTHVFVDILLSVDGDDNPLLDLRGLQFDFGMTSAALDLVGFTWMLDPGVSDGSYFQASLLPGPGAAYVGMGSSPGLIINLDDIPSRVASVELAVEGAGTLNVVGGLEVGESSVASFTAGFTDAVTFTLTNGNLNGGLIEFAADGSSGSDSDGDGVPDQDDAFPNDPDESVDTDDDGVGNVEDLDDDDDGVEDVGDDFPLDPAETTDTDGDGFGDNGDVFPGDPAEWSDSDGDGIGDNADTGSDTQRRFCGVATLSTSLFILCGLGALRLQRRRWWTAGVV